MAKKLKSYRLEEELLARVGAYAKSRGVPETLVVESALEGFLDDSRGGVPDLIEPPVKVLSRRPEERDLRREYALDRQQKLNEAKAAKR